MAYEKRIGNVAEHNYKFQKHCILDEIKELANLHASNMPVTHRDGTTSTIKMISLAKLDKILHEVIAPENLSVDEKK